MLTTFKNLKPFQLCEYILLSLFAFCIPLSWRISTYVMIGLFVITILKGIFEEGFKANQSQYENKVVYFISIAFWAIYAISFLYSENTAEARVQIGKKLSFILFPLFFLFSNLSYLTKERIRTIMYCCVFGIFTYILINFVWSCYDILFCDGKLNQLLSPKLFFKTNDVVFTSMHRAYFSIMSCVATAFCFSEFYISKSRVTRIFNLISLIILIIIPFFVTSRAGIICLVLEFIILMSWLIFEIKKTKVVLITAFSIIIFLTINYFAFPKSINRFTEAIDKMKDGKGDIRLTLRISCKNIISENLILGVGVGDRNDETLKAHYAHRDNLANYILTTIEADTMLILKNDSVMYGKYADTTYSYVYNLVDKKKYVDSDIKKQLSEYRTINNCIRRKLNAHNQYSDTLIAVGVAGLIILLGFFVVPVYLCVKSKKYDITFISLLFIIAFNCLFESVFERQMGIMFFAFFYFLFFHAALCQYNTSEDKIVEYKRK